MEIWCGINWHTKCKCKPGYKTYFWPLGNIYSPVPLILLRITNQYVRPTCFINNNLSCHFHCLYWHLVLWSIQCKSGSIKLSMLLEKFYFLQLNNLKFPSPTINQIWNTCLIMEIWNRLSIFANKMKFDDVGIQKISSSKKSNLYIMSQMLYPSAI